MVIKKFRDFAKEEFRLDGAKTNIDDILNKDIIILSYTLADTKYSKNKCGKYATVQFNYKKDDCKYIFFTGSDILIEQLERYKEEIPFETYIKKINRYYTFS